MDAAARRVVLDENRVRTMGTMLLARFAQYENDRKLTELKWARNARQKLGIYDQEIESQLSKDRSRAYPKLTRWKCVSMLSRIMNLLFQGGEKCWTVQASPVPNLSPADLAAVLATVVKMAGGREPTDREIEAAIRELARQRAGRLELEISDQLVELGGNNALDFVALCRKVLQSGIDYGCGILKGPFVDERPQRRWKRVGGQLIPENYTAKRPRYEFVPLWDYYPDMSAKTFQQMEGQFTRVVLSRQQLLALRQRPDFIESQIDRAVMTFASGNYKRRPHELELQAMGSQINVSPDQRNKYEAIVWEGNVAGRDLHAAGATMLDGELTKDVRACVWFLNDIVIKAEVDPWLRIAPDANVKMFHHFIFEEDESTLLGNGLPNIVRDSQLALCAAVRMEYDNGSIACGLNLEVNTELLSPSQDVTSNQPHKIWYRDDLSPTTLQYPAVRPIDMPSKIGELKILADQAINFSDQETFVGPATGGDMEKGPSEPLRTAAGASMLRGDAALPFKDVVRNFDVFTESVVGSIIMFNKEFNKNPEVQGDFQPVARGATSLMAKEVLGMQLDNIAATLTPEEKMYVNFHKLAQARVRVRDLDVEDIIVDDDEAKRREEAEQQQRAAQSEQQNRAIEAQIRETLSAVLKNIAQAGKNAAGAQATTANVILQAMEKGLSPNAIEHQIAGSSPDGTGAASTPVAGAGDAGAGGAGAPALEPPEGQPGAAPAGPAAGAPGPGAGAGFAAAPA